MTTAQSKQLGRRPTAKQIFWESSADLTLAPSIDSNGNFLLNLMVHKKCVIK